MARPITWPEDMEAEDYSSVLDSILVEAFKAANGDTPPLTDDEQATVYAMCALQGAAMLVERGGLTVDQAAEVFIPSDESKPEPVLTITLEDGKLAFSFNFEGTAAEGAAT